MWDPEPLLKTKIKREYEEQFKKELELIRDFSTIDFSEAEETADLEGRWDGCRSSYYPFNDRSLSIDLRVGFESRFTRFTVKYQFADKARFASDSSLLLPFLQAWDNKLKFEYGDRGGFENMTKSHKREFLIRQF
jgi:hypothetical protein